MDNVFATAMLQILEVSVKGAVCFALVPAIRFILSALEKLGK